MNLFIKRSSIFFLILALIAYILDFYISSNLKNSGNFAGGEIDVWNDIYEGKINTDVAIYGSSRAWVHIDPLVIEDKFSMNSYNFGIDGYGFWMQYLRHKELLEHNRPPKFILISLDVFTFTKKKSLHNYHQFLPFMFYNYELYNYTSSQKGFTFFDYTIPLYRYFGEIEAIKAAIKLSLFPKKNKFLRTKGFLGKEMEWNDDLKKAKERLNFLEIKIDSTVTKLFEQFLKKCNEQKIKVILVYTPEYIEGQNFVKNRNEVLQQFESFAKNHQLLYLNYSNHFMSYDKKYFYNALHLNSKGAELFTSILAQDLYDHSTLEKELK